MVELYCHSRACQAAEKKSGGKAGTWDGSKLTEHEYVSSTLDKENGWKVNGIRTQGGCRDSAADYRTVRCKECGAVGTYDFARD